MNSDASEYQLRSKSSLLLGNPEQSQPVSSHFSFESSCLPFFCSNTRALFFLLMFRIPSHSLPFLDPWATFQFPCILKLPLSFKCSHSYPAITHISADMAWSRSRKVCTELSPPTMVWWLPDGDCWFCPIDGSKPSAGTPKGIQFFDPSASDSPRKEGRKYDPQRLEYAKEHQVDVDLSHVWLPQSVRESSPFL